MTIKNVFRWSPMYDLAKLIIFIDMDGVIARWNEKASEEETHQKLYFLNREPEESSVELIKKLQKAGFLLCFLSSVYIDDHSIFEKNTWLDQRGFENIPRIFVPYGESKSDYIPKGKHILIDDYSKNLMQWIEAGGIAIKFFNGINNRPKLTIVDGVVEVKLDGWTGYSIDYRMTPQQMATIVSAVANAA